MTVEVYKPVLKSRPMRSSSVRAVSQTRPETKPIEPALKEVRDGYSPIQPRLELTLAIEELTHPEEPSYAELEAVILADQLQEAERYSSL